MPDDPISRWENEGGAVRRPAGGAVDGRQAAEQKAESKRLNAAQSSPRPAAGDQAGSSLTLA
jgi:hypothetical protein